MDLSRLKTLKKKLITAKNFRSVFDYFLDHFGEHERFFDLGRRVSDPVLEALIAAAGEALLAHEVRLSHVCLVEIPGHEFIHGALTMNGRPTNVLYFRDIQRGMLGVLGAGAPGWVHCVRFSAELMPAGWSPENN